MAKGVIRRLPFRQSCPDADSARDDYADRGGQLGLRLGYLVTHGHVGSPSSFITGIVPEICAFALVDGSALWCSQVSPLVGSWPKL